MRKLLVVLFWLAFTAAPAFAQNFGATAIVQGGNTAAVNASGQLSVNCGNCTGSGASLVDEAAFTEGTTSFAPVGGEYNTAPTSLVTGHAGIVEMTATRHMMVDVADALPAGANVIGSVGQNGTWTVSANAGTGTYTENLAQMGGTAIVANPCWTAVPTLADINITANTQIITGTAAKQVYICSFNLAAGGADNVALVEGTGVTCATGIAGMAGGATAATGWNFAANGGLTLGSGIGPVLRTATAADNVCLLVSGTAQVSGSALYVSN